MADARSYPYRPDRPAGHLPGPGFVLSVLPGTGDAIAAAEAVNAARRGDWGGAALGALGALPFVPGIVTSAIKKGRPFFHGTARAPDAEAIAAQGFTRGASAELRIPGTSLAANPEVSFLKFAHGNPYGMLFTTVPKDVPVYNLRPSEYLTTILNDGRTLADIKRTSFVGIPRSYYDETEVFVPADLRGRLNPRLMDFGEDAAPFVGHAKPIRDRWGPAIRPADPKLQTKLVRDIALGLTETAGRSRSEWASSFLSRLPRHAIYEAGDSLSAKRVLHAIDAIAPYTPKPVREAWKRFAAADDEWEVTKRRFDKAKRMLKADPRDPARRAEFDAAYKAHRKVVNDAADAFVTLRGLLTPHMVARAARLRNKFYQTGGR